MARYKISLRERKPFPPLFEVVHFHNGRKVKGGPIIGLFFEEEDAKEYCDFKNNKYVKKHTIKKGD
jgi:hypothetical protein